MKVFLANNCGLGDYILMNGATRYIVEQPEVEHVDLLCLSNHNKYIQVQRMYQDEPRITVHGEPCHGVPASAQRRKARKRGKAFRHHEHRVFLWEEERWCKAMLDRQLDPDKKNCWPELFYMLHGAPFSARHEHFYVDRDREKEDELFKELKLPSKYAICIDRTSGETLNFHPDTNLMVFKPRYRSDVFEKYYIWDWMSVIERAEEIHTIDTGWLHLLKSMRLKQPKFYYHYKAGKYKNIRTSCYINDEYDNGWQIIDDAKTLSGMRITE